LKKQKSGGETELDKEKTALEIELLQNKLQSKIHYFTQSTIADLA